MIKPNLDSWNEALRRMQEPFQAIAELNMKTLQGLSYLKPEELLKAKKPEEFVEQQVSLAVENGQKALDYMQKSFKIIEKAMQSVVHETKKKAHEVV
jgi:hypothetical protein